MKLLDFDAVQVGDLLPGLSEGPITRHAIGRYAGASGDYNPLHIDIDYARRAGMPDVFAHGMLSMTWLARALTDVVDQAAIRSLSVRFVAITHVGDEVRCRLRVTDKFVCDDEKRVALEVSATNPLGELRLIGSAVVALP
ncbi:MAG TPA: MaoC/PaaZ C-terminal domain-containing protein [Burkholderiaceae bacterium]|nr:MaoC/PaaZ C-terminal domain-containing protein [Burkholderiaceae bacterium]